MKRFEERFERFEKVLQQKERSGFGVRRPAACHQASCRAFSSLRRPNFFVSVELREIKRFGNQLSKYVENLDRKFFSFALTLTLKLTLTLT